MTASVVKMRIMSFYILINHPTGTPSLSSPTLIFSDTLCSCRLFLFALINCTTEQNERGFPLHAVQPEAVQCAVNELNSELRLLRDPHITACQFKSDHP